MTSLHWVVLQSGWSSTDINDLLEHGFYFVNELNNEGKTPLLALVENPYSSVSVIRALLQNGAHTDIPDVNGRWPLGVLLENRVCSMEIVELLLNHGADPNHRYPMGLSPLATVLRHSKNASSSFRDPGLREGILQALLAAGADVNSTNPDGQNLMCFALQNSSSVNVLNILLQAGAVLDACHVHTTPLLCATSLYPGVLSMGRPLKTEVVQFLLDHERASWGEAGLKPMMCALQYCYYKTKTIELLLDRASRRPMNHHRRMFCTKFLFEIIFSCNVTPAVVKLLIERGLLNVDTVNDDRDTLLHRALATERCDPEMIQVLLQKGCSVYARNIKFWTPLEVAIRYRRNTTILRLLLAGQPRIEASARLNLSLLALAIQKYDCRNTTDQQRVLEMQESLKILVKYATLEHPNFDIVVSFLYRCLVSKDLLRFADSCSFEVRSMKSQILGNGETLYDVVTQIRGRIEYHNIYQLLAILLKQKFPIYFNLILCKIDRKILLNIFQELPVYSCGSLGQKYFLNYYVLCHITEYLSTIDILNFVLAYYRLLPDNMRLLI